jgi:aryl-alcohol dehydrogenase-like predicted oxidoreductase
VADLTRKHGIRPLREVELEKRELGKSGLRVAPLALGTNVFGWTTDEPTAYRLLDAFVGAGFTLIDTADLYTAWAPGNEGGESEAIIGRWLKSRGRRDEVVIATKVGAQLAPDKTGLSRARIKRAVDDSLRRLQTDYIDLYQSHIDDAATPQQETLEAYASLIRDGKVRAIGASNFSAARLAEALAISDRLGLPRYQSLQPHYNLCERAQFEKELQPLCLREGLGVLSYWSLASGFLTGKYRTETDTLKSPRGAEVKKYLDRRGRRILEALDDAAAHHGATLAEIAIAWLIARPSLTAPIASATSLSQLEALIRATRLRLDPETMAQLDAASVDR